LYSNSANLRGVFKRHSHWQNYRGFKTLLLIWLVNEAFTVDNLLYLYYFTVFKPVAIIAKSD